MASSSVSDEDLDAKRAKAEKLREQIAAAQSDKATKVAAAENEIVGAQLDAEVANLEAQLARIKGESSVKAVKEGAAGPLAQAKEQLAQAQAIADGASVPLAEVIAEPDAPAKKKESGN